MGRRLAAILGMVLAAAGRVAADPCDLDVEDLRAEVTFRANLVQHPQGSAEKAERKTLVRISRWLRRRSTSFRRDADTASRTAEGLEGLYPSDNLIASHLDAMLDDLAGDLAVEREDLLLTASRLAQGPERTAAEDAAEESGAGLDAADAATSNAERGSALDGAALALESGYRAMLDRPDRKLRRTCGAAMLVRDGDGVLQWRADRTTAVFNVAGATLELTGVRARRPAGDSELVLQVRNFFGVGTYGLDFGSGLYRDGPFIRWGIVESGQVQVTAFDASAGVIEGTFTFTARGCIFDCTTLEAEDGSFRLRDMTVL
jgi:hypothetical protein